MKKSSVLSLPWPWFQSSIRLLAYASIVFLNLPLLLSVVISFSEAETLEFPPKGFSIRWYIRLFRDPQWSACLGRSLMYAGGCSILSVVLGAMAAYGSLQLAPRRSREILLLFFMLPLFVPPVAIGVGQFFLYSRIGLVDNGWGLVLSHSMLSFPFSFMLCTVALQRSGIKMEDVACSLGALRFYAFFRVVIPELMPSLFGSALLSFITSFDEAVVALFLTSHSAKTLPRQMFDGLRYDLDPTVAAVAGTVILIWMLITISLALRWPLR